MNRFSKEVSKGFSIFYKFFYYDATFCNKNITFGAKNSLH